MSIIRTDDQADALEILKLIKETADFHRAMGESLSAENIDNKLVEIAKQREAYIEPFQQVSMNYNPDPDKELVNEIAGKFTKLLASDAKHSVFDKCLEKDEHLAELVNNTKLGEHSGECEELLASLHENIINTREYLTLNN